MTEPYEPTAEEMDKCSYSPTEVGQCPRCAYVKCLTCVDLGWDNTLEYRLLQQIVKEHGWSVRDMVLRILKEDYPKGEPT